jgi:hypothetical protein
MTTTAESTSPTNDGSPSWLKHRSSIFNSNTTTTTPASNNKPSPKIVDKELARLKNIGAVSSVWSNKFVQEDSNISGGTTEYNKKRISPPLTTTEPTPPLSPRQHQRFENIDMSPRPNANYIPPGNYRRQSVVSPTPSSPNASIRSSRTLSGVSLKKATMDEKSTTTDDEQQQQQQQQAEAKNNDNNFGYFSKNSMSSLDLNEGSRATYNRSSVTSSITSSVPPSPIKTTATEETPTLKAKSSSNSISSVASVTIDDAASLWFQCETLKTQYAQSNARLTRANEDIEFYKRQLEQQGEVSRQGIATVVEEKEKELLRVRQLAELIVKQDKLLGEYEINLDVLTRLTNESVYLEETQAEMEGLRQELATLQKKKEQMEGAIEALKAELEMSYSQMRLMMVVSTEIQNEFDSYKEKMDLDIKEMMNNKQVEHEAELKALEEKLTNGNSEETVSADRSIVSSEEERKGDSDIAGNIAAAAAASAALMAAEHEKALGALVDRITTLTEALEAKDKAVSEALQEKDAALQAKDKALSEALEARDKVISEALEQKEKAINELGYQLKTQKMSTDAKMMMLNQTILEKDNLLMEFMSSRNNSREVISAAASMSSSPTSSAIPAADVTDNYYHQSNNDNEARLQISQARDYMYSSTDDESSDDDAEVIRISYSSDEEEEVEHQHIQQQNYDHFHQMNDNRNSSAPQSPADTVSTSVSFDSDEEQEKIAEIKHFSYSSVQSQATRPVSLISTTESLTSGKVDLVNSNNSKASTPTTKNSLKNSSTIPLNAAKETTGANWPMPPPTPPPSEPLPPVPVLKTQQDDEEVVSIVNEEASNIKPTSPIASMMNAIPPPRRARSKTMARDEAPNMSAYTTSVHQNNELPRIVPSQMIATVIDTTPVPPPRKDLPNITIAQTQQAQQQQGQQQYQHTKWMDDPESSEDDEVWSEANTATPTKQQKPQEWNVL